MTSWRHVGGKVALPAGAVLCLLLSIFLALLALEVARAQDALESGDVRHRVAPDDPRLWQADERVPLGIATTLLAIDDDVDFRRALRALRNARLDEASVSLSDPEIAIARNTAQVLLEQLVIGKGDTERRSRASSLLGVLGLARFVTETENRGPLIASTVATLRRAIALDPANDEAKFNLELALQQARGFDLSEGSAGQLPAPGGSGAKGAGAGTPGSGY